MDMFCGIKKKQFLKKYLAEDALLLINLQKMLEIFVNLKITTFFFLSKVSLSLHKAQFRFLSFAPRI